MNSFCFFLLSVLFRNWTLWQNENHITSNQIWKVFLLCVCVAVSCWVPKDLWPKRVGALLEGCTPSQTVLITLVPTVTHHNMGVVPIISSNNANVNKNECIRNTQVYLLFLVWESQSLNPCDIILLITFS